MGAGLPANSSETGAIHRAKLFADHRRTRFALHGTQWDTRLHAIPRIGQDVIIQYVNGDPDQPMITGRTYCGNQLPPYDLPDHKTRMTIKSQTHKGDGFNELRFEDELGKEEVFIHAQKDQNTQVNNNQSLTVGVDRTQKIGQDEFIAIGRNRLRAVKANDTLKVGGGKNDLIAGDYEVEAGNTIRLKCGKTLIEMHANGTLNITCETFNLTGQQSGRAVQSGTTRSNTMRKRISANNLKWACGWLAAATLALSWWQPLPFRSAANEGTLWIYGNPDARFTLALYANLECPHCRVYLQQLQRWIVTNDHVNLAWRHQAPPQHELAASRETRLPECAGQREGREGFWGAVVWVYLHIQGNERGLAAGTDDPDTGPSLQRCLAGEQAAQVVDTRKTQALQHGSTATPTLRLTDNHTQHTLILEGPSNPMPCCPPWTC